jgi:hypothetical protein
MHHLWRGESEECFAHCRCVHREAPVLLERGDRTPTGRLLDVGYLEIAQYAEPHVGVEDVRQILQNKMCLPLQIGCTPRGRADDAQREADSILSVVSALEQLTGGHGAE